MCLEVQVILPRRCATCRLPVCGMLRNPLHCLRCAAPRYRTCADLGRPTSADMEQSSEARLEVAEEAWLATLK